jgi:hypothetical protein
MAEKKNQLLKITLALYALLTLYYGIIYLFFPGFEIKNYGGEPISEGWVRWFGPVLLALSFGSMMMIRNPVKQGIFVLSLCIGCFLVSLTLYYELIFGERADVNILPTLIPAIVLTIVAVLFFFSLRQSKEILW